MTDPCPLPEQKAKLPTLPSYIQAKQQGPLNKLMGRMLAKRLPRLMSKGKIAPQSVKIGHKKPKEKATYY